MPSTFMAVQWAPNSEHQKHHKNKFIWKSLLKFFFLSLFFSTSFSFSTFEFFFLSCHSFFAPSLTPIHLKHGENGERKNNYCIWSYFRSLKLSKTIKWSSNCMWKATNVCIRMKWERKAFKCFNAKTNETSSSEPASWSLNLFQKAHTHAHSTKMAQGRKAYTWLLCVGAVELITFVYWRGWWKSFMDPDDTQTTTWF